MEQGGGRQHDVTFCCSTWCIGVKFSIQRKGRRDLLNREGRGEGMLRSLHATSQTQMETGGIRRSDGKGPQAGNTARSGDRVHAVRSTPEAYCT